MPAINLGMPEFDKHNWRDGALCAEIAPDLWFPEKAERAAAARARATCMKCEVRELCLDYAVSDSSIQHGIWGGMPPRELRRLRMQRGLPGYRLPDDVEPEDETVYDG